MYILIREFRLKQVPVERNSYFSGLGDDLYDHIEDAPKDTVNFTNYVSQCTHTRKSLGM